MEVKMFTAEIKSADPAKAFVGDNGIYVPSRYDARHHELLITKELFIEACQNPQINNMANYINWAAKGTTRYMFKVDSKQFRGIRKVGAK